MKNSSLADALYENEKNYAKTIAALRVAIVKGSIGSIIRAVSAAYHLGYNAALLHRKQARSFPITLSRSSAPAKKAARPSIGSSRTRRARTPRVPARPTS